MTYLSTDAGTPRKNTYQTFPPPSRQKRLAKGYRKLTPEGLQAAETAAKFNGLPADVQHPSQLLAAVKAAAPFLGLAQRLVWGLDWLFRFTRAQDWMAGSRPIVWPSARMQAEDLMLSPTRVKALNRALINTGLIAAADSPNGKRYGIRDSAGKIIEAYGFDLSPLAARYTEFREIAAEGRERRARMVALHRRATIARKAVAQLAALSAEYEVTDGDCLRTLAEAQYGLSTLKAIYNADELQDAVMAVEAARDVGCAILRKCLSEDHCVGRTPADHCVGRTPAEGSHAEGSHAESSHAQSRHAEYEHAETHSAPDKVRAPALRAVSDPAQLASPTGRRPVLAAPAEAKGKEHRPAEVVSTSASGRAILKAPTAVSDLAPLGAENRPHKEANKSSIHLKTPEVFADIRQVTLKTDPDQSRLQKKPHQASSKTDLHRSKPQKGSGENEWQEPHGRPALTDQNFEPLPLDLETKSWSAGRTVELAGQAELAGHLKATDPTMYSSSAGDPKPALWASPTGRRPALAAPAEAQHQGCDTRRERNKNGISGALWSKACREIGVAGAQKALEIVAAKDPAFFTRSPAHYFCGCVGQLSLQAG